MSNWVSNLPEDIQYTRVSVQGMNKEEIVNMGTEIGTYDISIEPYEDCCSFFVPLHPATSANIDVIRNIYEKLNLEELYHKIIENITVESISIYEKD